MEFREINIRGKSIFRHFRNKFANSSYRNDVLITCNDMHCIAGGINKKNFDNLWRIYFHIGYNLIKVEYSRFNSFVIFLANDRSFYVIIVIWNRGNH